MNKINLNNLLSNDSNVKYSNAKKAIALSKENPAVLYESFDFFVKLLDSENNIIKRLIKIKKLINYCLKLSAF